MYRRIAVAALFLCVCLIRAEDKKEEAQKVEEGKPAPDITLEATQIGTVLPDKKDAKTLSLEDFKNKKNVVLFFFPKALTKG